MLEHVNPIGKGRRQRDKERREKNRKTKGKSCREENFKHLPDSEETETKKDGERNGEERGKKAQSKSADKPGRSHLDSRQKKTKPASSFPSKPSIYNPTPVPHLCAGLYSSTDTGRALKANPDRAVQKKIGAPERPHNQRTKEAERT